jgi:hypothetical protein
MITATTFYHNSAWDESIKNMNDPSGRAVANVYDDAY